MLAAIRGRVKWQPDAPDPPTGYHVLAADIVEALDDPRLGPRQAHDIERAFFDDQ